MIKCKNCNFETKSVYTMEVHVSNGKTENFDCGLCEDIFVEGKRLEKYLRTCEIYECSYCWKKVENISEIKTIYKKIMQIIQH